MAYCNIKLYKQNQLKDKYVIIYYQHETILRYRTGVKVKPKDFDNRSETVKSSDIEYERKNKLIITSFNKIEEMILEYIGNHGIKPTGDYIKQELSLGQTNLKKKLSLELLDCYDDFIKELHIHFSSPDKSITSLKDYKSTRNALADYTVVVKKIKIFDLDNKIWLSLFNQFLAKDRPEIIGYKFKTRKQSDKTRHKRFACLKQFSNWLIEKKIIPTNENLRKFKIRVNNKDHYTLNMKEIKMIQSATFSKPHYQKAIDMFLFACHTGLRFSDIIRVNNSMIKKINGVTILKFYTKKTHEKAEIPLSKIAISILDRYQFRLNLFASQKVNEYLHDALFEISSFKDEYEYGNDGDTKPIFKQITFHTARRTFVTNLVNANISLNAVMKMTGHRKISTLQQYLNPDYELIMDNIKIFNEL
jgi:integrase